MPWIWSLSKGRPRRSFRMPQASLEVTPLEDRLAPAVIGGAGNLLQSFLAQGGSPGSGVTVATADMNGDGVPDVIAAAGNGSRISIFDGASGTKLRSFTAFAPAYTGGVSLATGDFNRDGVPDIVVGALAGGGPHVVVLDGLTGQAVRGFYAFDPGFTGGVNVAVGDLNGDGVPDIAVGAGPGGDPHVRVFDGATGKELMSFLAFSPGFTGGVSVALGDLNGDGYADLVVGAGNGGTSHVKVYDGRTHGLIRSFLAFAPSFTGGVSVAVGDATGDGRADLVIGAGHGGGPHVVAFDGVSGELVRSFYAYTPGFAGGVRVAAAGGRVVLGAGTGGDPHVEVFGPTVATPSASLPVVTPPPTSAVTPPDWSGWTTAVVGGTAAAGTASFDADGLVLREGDSFRVAAEKSFTVPASPTTVRVTFDAPQFDTTSVGGIRDAFEIAVLGADGSPLALPVVAGRDAAYNWSEQLAPVAGPGTTESVDGSIRTVDVNLSALPVGTAAKVVLRLVNDDTDNGTTVRVRRVDFVAATSTAPSGSPPPADRQPAATPPDLATLADVTPSAKAEYGLTTLTDQDSQLTTAVSVRNTGTYPVAGRLVVAIGNLSDPAVGVLGPDGYTSDGRPYFDFTPELKGTVLLPGQATAARTLKFSNPSRQRFTYDVQVLAGLDHNPVFNTTPVTQVQAGSVYRYAARAADSNGQPLAYSLVGGPTGLAVNPSSGDVSWATTSADVGNHAVRLRVSDGIGGSVEQSFTLSVLADIPNRPPVITSTPPTDATVAGAWEVQTLGPGPGTTGLAAADFGTGKQSLVSVNAGNQTLSVLGGQGNGKFAAATSQRVGEPTPSGRLFQTGTPVDIGLPATFDHPGQDQQQITGYAQADFNGDGTPDLVTALHTLVYNVATPGAHLYSNYVTVEVSCGDGTFAPPLVLPIDSTTDYTVDQYSVGVITGDFTGDGKQDILGLYGNSNGTGTNQFILWRGRGDGTFDAPVRTATGLDLVAVRAADFDGDGKLDLIAERASFKQFGILKGNGDGTFGPYTEFVNDPSAAFNNTIGIGRLHGRSVPDVVLNDANNNRLDVFLNDGAGHLTLSTTLNANVAGGGFNQPLGNVVGDFTGTSHGDIVFWTYAGSNGGGGVGTFKGAGDGVNFSFVNANPAGTFFPQVPTNGSLYSPVDLNGDGKPDIVLGHAAGTHGVEVGLNNGDGTFAFTDYQVAGDPSGAGGNTGIEYGVLAGDYNRDGVMDLAVVSGRQYPNARVGVTILYGNTPGTFTAPTAVTVQNRSIYGGAPYLTLIGDVNGDGIPDLVTADNARWYTSLGRGDGTFGPHQLAGTFDRTPTDAFLADINHDGKLDLVWTGGLYYSNHGGYGAALGNGDGTFTQTYSQDAGNFYGANVIVPGDFNGDGFTDFAAFNPAIYAPGTGTYIDGFYDVFLYDPAHPGTFTRSSHKVIPVAGTQDDMTRRSFTAGDFDGDGKLDLVSIFPAVGTTPMQLLFFKGNGDGTFADPTSTPVFGANYDSQFPKWMAAADLNGDGKLDLVVTSASNRMAVLLGNGDGTFGSPIEYSSGVTFTTNRQVYLTDIDGDGKLDFVAIDNRYGVSGNNIIAVRHGNGDGTFGPEELYNTPGTINYLSVGDVNGDGVPDVVADMQSYGGGYGLIFTGQEKGLTSVTTADVTGDGKKDVIATNFSNNRVKLLAGNGDNTFTRRNDLIVGRGPVAVATLPDPNGTTDIVTANRLDGSVTLLKNAGGGNFTRTDITVGGRPVAMAVGDLTGNGKADVVVADDKRNSVIVLLNDGAGGFAPPLVVPLGDKPNALTIADVTGDGKPDLIVSLPNSKRLMILPGNGDGTFAAPIYVDLPAAAGGVTAADFNQDGKVDLAVTLPSIGQVAVLFARGSGLFSKPQTISVGKTPTAISAQDVDGDGRPDLLVANADGTASVILNKFDATKLYRYTVTATDPDGDPVTFGLTNAPGGMVLNPTTGEIVWAPTADQIGPNPITITASDGRGGTASQTFSIAVTPTRANAAPVFVSAPVTTVASSDAFSYSAKAIDANGDTLRYRLVSGPAGATVDPLTGVVNWDPRNPALQMSDGSGYDSGQVTIPDSPTLHPASLTTEGWFRIDDATRNQLLVSKVGPNGDINYPVSFALQYVPGALRGQIAGIDSGGNNVLADLYSGWTPAAGRWYHLAMTFDDATGTLALLIDGRAVASRTVAGHITYNGSPVQIGVYGNGIFGLVGSASNVRLWGTARTAADIQADMTRDVAANAPGLLCDLRFRDGDAVTLRDSSVNHNDGRRGGTPFPVAVPGMADPQSQTFTIRVEDGKGGSDLQTFTVNVVSPVRSSITGTVSQAGGGPLAGWVVFDDANGNGYLDAGEQSATTAADGTYTLPNLLAGTYTLAVQPRAGFVTPAAQTATVAAFTDTTADFSVTPLPLGQIRGTVTATGPAVPGWVVFLDANGNTVRDAGEVFTTTDALGNYAFTGLAAGTYSVRFDPPSGWKATAPAGGGYSVALAADGTSTGNDFTVAAVDAAGGSRPRFVTTPSTSVVARSAFRYAAVALDPAGRPITYSLSLAPAGMVIDPASGQIAWTPTLGQVGPQQVIVKAANDLGGVDLQAFTLTVGSPNTSPLFSSTPPAGAFVGVPLQYDVFAQDAEQTALAFAFDTAPAGAAINPTNGRITWTPTAGQLGPKAFVVEVGDGAGGVTRQAFSVNVTPAAANNPPTITSLPRTTARAGFAYVGRLTATDPDGDPLAFALVSGPTGLTLSTDGYLTWTPIAAQLGPQAVSVTVSDGRGGSDAKSFTIGVGNTIANAAPVVTSTPPVYVKAGNVFAYTLTTIDADNDPVAYQLLSAPAGMSLDTSRGTVRWQPALDQLGPATVSVRAYDPFGGETTQTFTVTVRGADGPPVVTSVPPTETNVGGAYLYSVKAVDLEGDPLVFSLLQAPAGMTLNPVTGEIAWTPTAGQVGQQAVIIQVSNGAGGYTTQGFAVKVLAGAPIRPPAFTTDPPLFAAVGTAYTFTASATDPQGQAVTYQLRTGPAGMSVDAATGVVQWTPTAPQTGTQVVTIAAFDTGGAAGLLSFEMSVLGVNHPPVINGTAPTQATAGATYRYDVAATDADLDPLTYTLVNAPAGMTVDVFGRVSWKTTPADIGPHTATVRVSDPRGGTAEQTIAVNVAADTTPPRVAVIAGQNVVRALDNATSALLHLTPDNPTAVVRVAATDDVGVVGLTVTANGKAVVPDSAGTLTFHFQDWGFGTIRVVATAVDAAGNAGTGKGGFAFAPYGYDPDGDIRDPGSIPTLGVTAVITSPAGGDDTRGFVRVTGTAASPDFTGYKLLFRRADDSTYTAIASGTAAVNAGTLGTWDTTLLPNGGYVLRLEEYDAVIGTTAAEVSVGVSGNFKLGNFRLSFTDLTLPVAGLPVSVVRTYDSLDSTTAGDLGYGWRLEFRDTHLQVGLPKSGLEDVGIYTAFRPGVKVYLTLPGGERQGFTFTPDLRALPGFGGQPLVIATPRFTSDRGVTSTLTVRGGGLVLNAANELTTLAGTPWNPADPDFGGGYTLTTADGTRYFIDGTSGLMQTATDRNGNALTFSDGGITSSSGGVNVTFARDAKGRIVGVTDPAGNTVHYAYDVHGDLVNVTDRMGNVTKFTYRTDRPHYLDSVIDPLGRTRAKVLYDANGRLVGTVNAAGGQTAVSYDPNDQLVMTTDALGNPTTAEYDGQGNVVATTDALGGVTRYTYDANNKELSVTDPLGRITVYTRDGFGRELTRTDPLGNVTRKTYDAFGNELTKTDALGNSARNVFDAAGNLTLSVDVTGAISTFVNDSSGRVLSAVLPSGATLNFEYSGGTQATAFTDANGLATAFTYDANGRETSRTSTVQTAGGRATATATTAYDADGRVVAVTDALGNTTRTEYDATGRVTATVDALGGRTTFAYDPVGHLILTTRPDGSTLQAAYDADGRKVSNTDAAGRVTRYEYDVLGRLTATDYPDGTRTVTEYDAAGQATATVDELGDRTQYQHDADGRQVAVTDPLGTVTRTTYDAIGNVLTVTDPLGHVVTDVYDQYGRMTGIVNPDGTSARQTLDAAGRVVALTDENGRTTRFQYTAGGQLADVTDALGNVTRYEYDTSGRLTSQTDANGHVTHYEYDVLGRLTARILPGGQAWRTEYDALGRIARTTDPDGNVVAYAYDSLGRVVAKTRSDGVTFAYTYTATGQLATATDPRGVTTYAYDAHDRLLASTGPDGQAIRYTYDAAGRTATVTTPGGTVQYAYDADGRLTTVTDPTLGETRYTYNAAGQLTRTDFPNGVSETRTYDVNGRLTGQTATGLAGNLIDYHYTYDPTGRVVEFTGDGATVDYTYDADCRLVREHTASGTDVSYTYDAVGNRLTRTDANGATVYQYDINDRLTRTTTGAAVTVYSYDAAGNQIRSQSGADHSDYTWDAENRMTRADVTAGGTTSTERSVYDASGNRVAVLNAGGETRYLLDVSGRLPRVVAEYTPTGGLTATTVYGDGLIGEDRGGVASTFLTDGLGSVRVVSSAAGLVLARYGYDAFGNVSVSSGVSGSVFRFTGQPQSALTGLMYLRARLYDPATGRFQSSDPFTGLLALPMTRNKYLYVLNDPLNLVDPTGLEEEEANLPEFEAVQAAGEAVEAEETSLVPIKDEIVSEVIDEREYRLIQASRDTEPLGKLNINIKILKDLGKNYRDGIIRNAELPGNSVKGPLDFADGLIDATGLPGPLFGP